VERYDPQLKRRVRRHAAITALQRAFWKAVLYLGCPPYATVHTLRQAFATHRLQSGTGIRTIQERLGQLILEATMIGLHVGAIHGNARSPVILLFGSMRPLLSARGDPMKRSALLLMAMLALPLWGCSGKQPATTAAAGPAEQDVASVRAFLDHVETTFNGGNLDRFIDVFADDAVMLGQNQPDAMGKAAIRKVYADALAQYDMKVEFHTLEIEVAGNLAYERGTYALHLRSRADASKSADVTNRHIHVLRRQPDGSWKTWRMMTNSAESAPT
jgi:uncharacterized protein (TIGR02246 family)